MGDNKYFKFYVNLLDEPGFKVVNKMFERDLIIYVYLRLAALATKHNNNGVVYFVDEVPYTVDRLSKVVDRPKKKVDYALRALQEAELIYIEDDGNILLTYFELFE